MNLLSKISILVIAAMHAVAPNVRAQTPIAVETTAWGPMGGFELYGSGINWWNGGYRGDEVIPRREGQIAINHALSGIAMHRRNGNTYFPFRSDTVLANGAVQQHVARSESDIFFFADSIGQRIFKKPIYGRPEGDFGIDFSGVTYTETGAMITHAGYLIWSVAQGAQTQVRMKPLAGGPGGGDEIIMQDIGLVKKMAVTTVIDSEGGRDLTYLIMLTTVGNVFTYILESVQNPGPFFLGNNITDFAIRNESWTVSNANGIQILRATKLYVTTGVNISSTRVQGYVVTFDLTHGGSAIDYQTGNVNLQLTGIAVDNDRLFITRTPVILGSGLFPNRLDQPNSQLLRKFSPGRDGFFVRGEFETIVLQQEGRNMRSDHQWLYWASGNQIRKIKTDAPAIELDYVAGGVEAIQAVQTFNNAIPLVAGKPTLVRAYAQQLKNTTGKSRFPLIAQIRGYLDGAELPGGPVFAYNSPTIDAFGDLPSLRSDLNRSFLFELPASWVARPGQLRLDYILNPQGSVPETGTTPLANNSNGGIVQIVAARIPNLVFKEIQTSGPNYTPSNAALGFADIVDRATTVMPLSHFRIFFSPGAVTRPQWTVFGIRDRTFDIPGQDKQALAELDEAREDAHDPGPDTHWIGTISPEITGWNGLGYRPGNSALVRMDGTGSWVGAWGSILGGHTLAHELGHNYGRMHIDQTMSPTGCGTDRPGGSIQVLPDNADPCFIGITDLTNPGAPIGYDWRTGALILPGQAADMMTYNDSVWISPFNWNGLISAIPATAGAALARQAADVHPDIFRIPGIIYPTAGTAVLLPAIHVSAGTLSSPKVLRSLAASAALPPDAPYRLRLIGNPQAAPLAEHSVEVKEASEETGRTLHFIQSIPFIQGVTRIQLVHGAAVLAEIIISANAPVLELDAPLIAPVLESLSLTWNAADADGDPLFFSTQISNDDGATWNPITVKDSALGISVSTKLLAGGDQSRLRVIATDGLNTTIAITEAFVLPGKAPQVSLHGITDRQQFESGEYIFARVLAYDPEDGSLDGGSIAWTLTGPEDRTGAGGSFSLRGLPPGDYTLEAVATDSAASTGSATVTFSVRPIAVPTATSAPIIDGLCSDASYNNAAVVMMKPDSGIAPPSEVRMVRFEGNVYICFAELSYGATPASVGIYFDTDGNPTPTPQASDVGFGVSQDGIPSQVAGNGTVMAFQPFISPGFKTAVLLGDNSWSAEFCIPESLLGGWDHDAGLMLVHYYPNDNNHAKIWPPKASVNEPTSYVPASLGPLPPAANRAPVAVAHGPAVVSVNEAQAVTLDGRASYDLDQDALTYSWSQTAGPSVTLDDASSARPSFTTPDIAGSTVIKFELVANDGTESSLAAEVVIQLDPVVASTATNTEGGSTTIEDGVVSGTLRWEGAVGSSVMVEASTDLESWTPVGSYSVDFLNSIVFSDATAGQEPYRFYRALQAPATDPIAAAGSALEFDGTDDWVSVPHETRLNTFPFTVTFWLKTVDTGTSARGLVVKYADGSANGMAVILVSGRVRAFYFKDSLNHVYDGGLGLDSGFLANGAWHHIAFVVDSDSGYLYLDGFKIATMDWIGTPGAPSSGQNLQFGRYNLYPNSLNGQMDEITLWNKALTEADIQSFMNHPLAGSEEGLLGYWPLNEGNGTTTLDLSGNTNNGVFQNAPAWIESTAPLFE